LINPLSRPPVASTPWTLWLDRVQGLSRAEDFRRVLLKLCLLVVASATACSLHGAGDPNVLRIGAAIPLTGASAAWGEQARWGIEFAVQTVNDAGGIDGRRVVVVHEDSQALPRPAVTAFHKLTQVNRVPVVVGDVTSAATLAMARFAEERHVTLIAPTSSAPAITTAGRFVFRVWPSDRLEGEGAATWASAQRFSRVAILHIANDYGAGLAAAFQTHFARRGGRVVSVQAYAQGQTDFRPFLTRAKAERVDAVYLVSDDNDYKDAALVLKQGRDLGVEAQFIGTAALENPELIRLAGPAAEDVVYPTTAGFDSAAPMPRQKAFVDKFTAKYGKAPDWASSHAHDAALIALDALKSGARTGEEIRAMLDRTRKFEGVTGTIRFDENGDVIDTTVLMKTVHKGEFVALPPKS
jgi:branched-chain amino acid transport system substrate-binding protein